MRHYLLICLLLLFAAPLYAQDAESTAEPETRIGLEYGVSVNGSLGNAAPRILYAFDGLRGEIVRLRLNVTAGDLDPMITVLDSRGVPIVLKDDGDTRSELRVDSFHLPRSDRYTIVVSRFGGVLGATSGGYTINIDRVGVSSSSGSSLRYGDTVINEITERNPQIYYSFRARRGDIVNVRMQRISGNLDTYLQIVNQRAIVISDNDDVPGSGSLDAEIDNLVIEEDGMYVIIATRFGQAAGSSSGAFFLTLEEAADSGMGNTLATALDVLVDMPMEGELNDERFARYYRFEARANDVVTVRMERIGGGLDAFLSLIDVNGVELASNDDTEGSQNSAIVDFLIPADGTYYLIATRYEREVGKTQGRYRLTFERRGNALQDVPANMTFMPYGSTITGTITDETPRLDYAFYGQAGDSVTVAMSRADGDLDPVVEILDETMRVVASNDDSDGSQNARIERYRLPVTGVYYIRATRYQGGNGPGTRGSFILVFNQRVD
jgi:hypothetical protein